MANCSSSASMSGRPPLQSTWCGDGVASMDLFVVPTISFQLLYGFLILRHSRREILWLGATTHPTAQWIAHQLSEAYGWQRRRDISFAIENLWRRLPPPRSSDVHSG